MYLKTLIIKSKDEIIREINFKQGLNLIVDNTPVTEQLTTTGNNVGKTTVLKLIDFCFGASVNDFYKDQDSNTENIFIKDFLEKKEICIKLTIISSFSEQNPKEIIIERNFLKDKRKILNINDNVFSNIDVFKNKLKEEFFPNLTADKPTFKQLFANHNRYSEHRLTHTVQYVNQYTKYEEYESIYLFKLGIDPSSLKNKNNLQSKLDILRKLKKRLEATNSKSEYEIIKLIHNKKIQELTTKIKAFEAENNFRSDFEKLADIKKEIKGISRIILSLKTKKDLILEIQEEIESQRFNEDIESLKQIYSQARANIENLSKSFEEMVIFHNTMLRNKFNFIQKELPEIEQQLKIFNSKIDKLVVEENEISIVRKKILDYGDYEELTKSIFGEYQKVGEIDSLIKQIEDVDNEINNINISLSDIGADLFSKNFQQLLANKLSVFNDIFSEISNNLYEESFALNQEIKNDKNERKYYKFYTFNLNNQSSGKKQGEILCFDISLILYARAQGIPTFQFLLTDKKELMHDNQLINIANLVNRKEIQLITSILYDKLPAELRNSENIILRLSQSEKLFKIENQAN